MENGENGTKIPTISEAAREQNVRPKVMGTMDKFNIGHEFPIHFFERKRK